jgi:hypothetical protein
LLLAHNKKASTHYIELLSLFSSRFSCFVEWHRIDPIFAWPVTIITMVECIRNKRSFDIYASAERKL